MFKVFLVFNFFVYLYLHVYFFFQSYFYCLCVIVISVNWKLMTLKQIPCMRKHKALTDSEFHRLQILLLYGLSREFACTSLNSTNEQVMFFPSSELPLQSEKLDESWRGIPYPSLPNMGRKNGVFLGRKCWLGPLARGCANAFVTLWPRVCGALHTCSQEIMRTIWQRMSSILD